MEQEKSRRIQEMQRVVAQMLAIIEEVEKTTSKAKQMRLLTRAIDMADAVLDVRVRDLPSWELARRKTIGRLHNAANHRSAARLRGLKN